MKKKLLFISLCAFSCLFSINVRAQVYPEDLLVDNFNDADLTLANWDGAVGASGWNTAWSANEGIDGGGCIKIVTGSGGFWNTAIGPWIVGHKYKISCMVKGSGNNASPLIFNLHGVSDIPNTPCPNAAEKEPFDTCTVFPLTTTWQKQEATFVAKATTTPLFNITLWCFKGGYPCMTGWANANATDETLVDNFQITDLGPANPVVVVGEDLLVDNFNDADLALANWDGAIGASGWNTEWSATEGRDGTGCVKIVTGSGGFWNTALGPWPVDHKFKVSCWVKGAGANASPVIFNIHGVNDIPNTPCNNSVEKEAFDTCTVFPLTQTWQLQEATFITRATTVPLFNITVWCFKGGYPCMTGWANANATDASLVDDFKITDLGFVGTTGLGTLQNKPLIYVSDNKLRNVFGLVSVYDIMGRLVVKSVAYEGTLNVASLKPGIYIVHANNSAVKIVR